ncbi:hypothetical protein [Frondihabitans cladoniiphilus]|uniref:GNAT family N-acetyltransferase n=1 Tax=Frondihabitans cladoniiphilus TaxID=715785 RepID=A0ABP8W8G7_9MICO
MLDETGPDTWLVRAAPEAPPEAVVEAFSRGYRLSSWSLVEAERQSLGVFMTPGLAETAWWRHLDRADPRPAD